MEKDEIVGGNVVSCPKCGGKLRKVSGNVDSHKNFGAVGTDLYCDKCKDVVMTVFD
jgi:ssDNA-binding Zn-finger/Zn-ribbon topoisomerase 1